MWESLLDIGPCIPGKIKQNNLAITSIFACRVLGAIQWCLSILCSGIYIRMATQQCFNGSKIMFITGIVQWRPPIDRCGFDVCSAVQKDLNDITAP